MVKKTIKTTLLGAGFCVASLSAAWAEETESRLDLSLGLTGGVIPEYSGSGDIDAIVFPLVLAKYRINEDSFVSFTPYDGLSFGYDWSDAISVGLNADFRQGRDSSDDSVLNGMADLDPAVEVGPWVKYRNNNVTFSLNLGFDVTDEYNGFVGEAAIRYDIPINHQWEANIGVATLYGNDNYVTHYYGVDSTHTTANRPLHEPGSGFNELTVSGGATYFLSEKVFLRGDVGYKRLLSDAKKSPIVLDQNQWRGFLSVGYKF